MSIAEEQRREFAEGGAVPPRSERPAATDSRADSAPVPGTETANPGPDSAPGADFPPGADSTPGAGLAMTLAPSAAETDPTAGPSLAKGQQAAAQGAGDRLVPRGLQVAAGWAWRVILVAALAYGLFFLAGTLSEVVIPVAIAILLAAMLSPVTNRLHRWGLRRSLATAVTVLGGIALIVGSLYLIGATIAGQATQLSGNVVESFNQLTAWLRRSPIPIDPNLLRLDNLTTRLEAFLRDSQSTIAAYAGEVGTRVGHFFAGVAITVFALFYFLYDGRGIFRYLLAFFPREVRERVDQAASKGWRSLSSYVRATVLVALSDAVGVLIVALILQVPLAPALAALVFIGAFVPLVGAFVSGFVAVAVALVALGFVQALIMLGGIILVMQVEGHILQPFLLGHAVKLHPLAVLLAIAIGILVGGIVGALLAVPLLAFTKSFVQYLHGAEEPTLARLRLRPLTKRS